MKKQLIVLLFAICLVSTIFIKIPDAKAISYYNWIMGSEMESTTNRIEDGGFESGDWNSGVLYGNWSVDASPATIQESYVHDGVYAVQTHYTGNQVFWYNFTDSILGSDIVAFSFWVYGISYGNAGGYVRVYYSDGSYDDSVNIDPPNDETWLQIDLVSQDFVNGAKYVVALYCYMSASDNWAWDDFFLGIEDMFSQDQYDFDTFPWRTTGIAQYWQQIGYWDAGWFSYIPFFPFDTMPVGGYVDVDMIGHNLVWGRNSNGSGYIGYDESTAQFIQDIGYLDSDSVHYVDLWAYSASEDSVAVKVNLIYADRTFDSKSVNITVGAGVWEHLNFGGSWIDDNKYIVQIQIQLANYYGAYVNIDDVGIWSSLPANSYRFTYTLSPSAISQSPIGFNAYQGQTYTFTGYLWDINNELTENGTVTVSHSKGMTTATLSSGIFSFSIVPRTGTGDFTEQMGISVNNGDTVEYYELTINWIYVSGAGDGDRDEERTTNLIDWLVMFMVIFLPALLFAGGIYENNQQPDSMHISPMFGLIAGLVLSVGIGVYTALVPLWMLILMIIAVVLLFVGIVRR